MISSRTFAGASVLPGACALILAACSPANRPYEPPQPAAEDAAAGVEQPVPDAAPSGPEAEDITIPAAGEDPDADTALDAEQAHAGEPHVHGGGDLSVTREDDFLTVTLDAPLANFGLAENKAPQGKKAEDYATGIAEPVGPAECAESERSVDARTNGEHGAMTISVVWRCKKIERVEGLRVNLFDMYPAFQHVDAIYLGPNGEQVAGELTPTHTELDFD